jgi:hypothetical protein
VPCGGLVGGPFGGLLVTDPRSSRHHRLEGRMQPPPALRPGLRSPRPATLPPVPTNNRLSLAVNQLPGSHVWDMSTPAAKRAELPTHQCFPNIAGCGTSTRGECRPAAGRSIAAGAAAAVQSSHRLACVSGTCRQPDRVTGAEPTNDDRAAGVCRRSSSGRPGCSSCAPTANVATSIFRPRRRRR